MPSEMTAPQIYAKPCQFDDDNQFIYDNYEELLKNYPEQWVAVFEGTIVAVASGMADLVKLLDDKGISSGSVAHHHLSANPPEFIF